MCNMEGRGGCVRVCDLESSEIHRSNPLLGARIKTGGGPATAVVLVAAVAVVVAVFVG